MCASSRVDDDEAAAAAASAPPAPPRRSVAVRRWTRVRTHPGSGRWRQQWPRPNRTELHGTAHDDDNDEDVGLCAAHSGCSRPLPQRSAAPRPLVATAAERRGDSGSGDTISGTINRMDGDDDTVTVTATATAPARLWSDWSSVWTVGPLFLSLLFVQQRNTVKYEMDRRVRLQRDVSMGEGGRGGQPSQQQS